MNYIDYGTIDPIVIDLQITGILHHLSIIIINKRPQCVNNTFISVDDQELKISTDKNQFSNEYAVLQKYLTGKIIFICGLPIRYFSKDSTYHSNNRTILSQQSC